MGMGLGMGMGMGMGTGTGTGTGMAHQGCIKQKCEGKIKPRCSVKENMVVIYSAGIFIIFSFATATFLASLAPDS